MTAAPEPEAEAIFMACSADYAFRAGHLAWHFAALGDREKAWNALASEAPHAAGRLASVPALIRLGDLDAAMDRVEQAAEAGVPFLPLLLAKPESAALGRHPRHARLMARIAARPTRSESGRDSVNKLG
ncbi:MAG: hypothetical protein SNJ79_07475 [Sphingomonadaceae bacterium]